VTALVDVGCRLPDLSVDIGEIGQRAGASDRMVWMFRRLFGLRAVRRAPDQDLTAIMTAAVRSLDRLGGQEHRVRYVIAARTITTVSQAGEHPVEDLCAELGLVNATAFTLTQHACATGLLAVDLAGQLLAADGDPAALALVITGEKIFTSQLEIIPDCTVFGESTAACLVGAGGSADRVLGYAVRTHGQHAGHIPPRALAPAFLESHDEVLAAVITDAAEAAGVPVADLDLILPHNVNRRSWLSTCRLLGIGADKVFLDNVPVTGHCFAADPFINYVAAREAGRLPPGTLYLMASVGLGATFSAMVLRH
jgi:3-oxoacyl-[acyl-carrier-protein] synthase III